MLDLNDCATLVMGQVLESNCTIIYVNIVLAIELFAHAFE